MQTPTIPLRLLSRNPANLSIIADSVRIQWDELGPLGSGAGAAVGGGAVGDGVGAADVRAIDVGDGEGDSVGAASIPGVGVVTGRSIDVVVGGGDSVGASAVPGVGAAAAVGDGVELDSPVQAMTTSNRPGNR